MRLTADLHTHTVHSHGRHEVADNVEAAISHGLTAVGIADHSISHVLYGVKKRRFGQYISCIEEAKRKYADRIDVKTGVELNLVGMDGSVDMPRGYDFDVVILGYHKAAMCRDLKTAWRFIMRDRFSKEGKTQITNAYMHALQKYDIDILAHPGYGVPIDYRRVAQACADYGTYFEINNKHTELTAENLQIAADTGVKFIISSDAHSAENVGLAPHAISLAAEAELDIEQIVNAEEESH